jgi:hypothetical protein
VPGGSEIERDDLVAALEQGLRRPRPDRAEGAGDEITERRFHCRRRYPVAACPQRRSADAPMSRRRGRAIVSRMNADSFIFLALEAVGVLALVLPLGIVLLLGSHGPEMDA